MDAISNSGAGAGSSSSAGMYGYSVDAYPGLKKKRSRKAKGKTNKDGKLLPPSKQDAKLSVKHHKDSVMFNLAHAKDHLDEAKKHADGLKQVKSLEKKLATLKKGKVKF